MSILVKFEYTISNSILRMDFFKLSTIDYIIISMHIYAYQCTHDIIYGL